MVIDYRRLNNLTIKDRYSLPRIDDCLAELGGQKFFSSFDATSGFHSVKMHDATKELTAFITHEGLYEWNVLPFGLANSPAVYQRFMNAAFAGITWKYLLVFVDDLCVYSQTFEQHCERLGEVFARARAAGVFFNPPKCHILRPQIDFLGFHVTREGIKPQKRIVEKLEGIKTPRTKKEMQQWVGLAQFVAQFVEKFSRRVKGLRDIQKLKCRKYSDADLRKYNIEAHIADVIGALSKYPVLRHPDYDKKFWLRVDGSIHGLGATLLQKDEETGKLHPVFYASKSMPKVKKTRTQNELEVLAVLFGLDKFRPFLLDKEFVLQTDHANLRYYINNADRQNWNMQRWLNTIATFNFTLEHVPAKTVIVEDVMGRIYEHVDDASRRDDAPMDEEERRLFVDYTNQSMREAAEAKKMEEKKAYVALPTKTKRETQKRRRRRLMHLRDVMPPLVGARAALPFGFGPQRVYHKGRIAGLCACDQYELRLGKNMGAVALLVSPSRAVSCMCRVL